jgi:hypothetical protein
VKIRLDQLAAELERRKRLPSPTDHYPPAPWRRRRITVVSRARRPPIDELMSRPNDPSKSEANALADEWLADRFPLAFGAEGLPIDPKLLSIVREAAADFPSWARTAINFRLYRRNTNFKVLLAIARPGAMWVTLHGRAHRPVELEEQHKAQAEVRRLEDLRRSAP